jgi:hypothetical protein
LRQRSYSFDELINMPRAASFHGAQQAYAPLASPGSGRPESDEHADDGWSAGEDADGDPGDEVEGDSRKRKIRPLSVSCELVSPAIRCICSTADLMD